MQNAFHLLIGFLSTGQTERKISFVLHEPDNESEGSSNTTVTMQVTTKSITAILKKTPHNSIRSESSVHLALFLNLGIHAG